MRTLLDARRLAESLKDWEISGAISLNIASIYQQMGEWSGAYEETQRAVAALKSAPGSPYRPQALAQTAKLRARGGDLDGALPEFFAALREADAQGNLAFKSLVLNQLGYEYLNKARLAEAERAMTESFRLRSIARSRDISQSYRALGMLRMAQGDLAASGVLLDRAIAAAERNPGKVPNWAAYHARGELRMRQRRLAEAAGDFRTALDMARRWRLEVLPADAIRTSAEVDLEQLSSSFIRAAGELYFETRRPALAAEAFSAAEEIRAAGLTRDARWRDKLPAEYGRTLAELRSARGALLRVDSADARARILRLRNKLAEMEMRAGLETAAENGREEIPRLAADAALISFHLDEPYSYAWTVTREGLAMHKLAGAGRIRKLAGAFSESIRRNSMDAAGDGERLYAELFGAIARGPAEKRHWLLAVEDVLLGTPFAALVAGRDGAQPVYLVERHSIAIVPSARMMGQAFRPSIMHGRFVGIGDPIYNTADERWRGRLRRGDNASLQLPRLAGSAREIRESARAWGAPAAPELLEGQGATREALAGAVAGAPGVVHFATHVVSSRENPARRLIPLSLLPGGAPDLVGPEEIASWKLPRPALVVISGCASGAPERRVPLFTLNASPLAPEPPPAELGLVGLARAWLSAGAGAVALTHWPTPDDTGELFLSFYHHLRDPGGPGPAAALERAQLDMLRSHTWRSSPKYWAAYLIVGRG